MTAINTEKIKSILIENQKLKSDLFALQNKQYVLEHQLTQIYSAKSYKLWQKFTRIKNIFINYLKIKFNFIKKTPNPVKKFLKNILFLYFDIRFFFKLKTTQHYYLIKNNRFEPKVSILIPTFGSTSNLARLLNSIKKYPEKVKYEVLICNDNPTSITEVNSWIKKNIQLIRKIGVTIISATNNLGFVGSINKLANISKGEYLFLLNDDTEIINNNWLSPLLKPFNDSQIGATGSFLLFPDKYLVQHAGMYPFKKLDGKIWNYHFYKFFNKNYPEIKTRNVPMITGAALLIPRKLFSEIGQLNIHYLGAGGFDDSDLCNKITKINKKIMFIKESKILHYEGLSANTISKKYRDLIVQHNQNYFLKKWIKFIFKNYPEYV